MESRKPRPKFAYAPVPVPPATTPTAELQPVSARSEMESAATIAGAHSEQMAYKSAMPPIPGSVVTPNPSSQFANQPSRQSPDRSADQRAALKRRAIHRESNMSSSSVERTTAWLREQGLAEDEAATMAADVRRQADRSREQAAARRKAAASQQRADNGLAVLEIIAGVVLLVVGLAAGWFVGLFVVPIIDGFRRLG